MVFFFLNSASPQPETVLPEPTKDKSSLFSMASLMRPSVTSSGSAVTKNVLTGINTTSAAEVSPSLGNIATLASGNLLANLQNGLNIPNGLK